MIDNSFQTFSNYIREYSLTPNEEDYIEMIYRISLTERVKVKTLAKHLNVKAPSVTKMIKKLSLKNLVIYEKYGGISLTLEGKKIGERLLFRHNVLEEFVIMIGCKENILEKIEKLEHVIDEELLMNISKFIESK